MMSEQESKHSEHEWVAVVPDSEAVAVEEELLQLVDEVVAALERAAVAVELVAADAVEEDAKASICRIDLNCTAKGVPARDHGLRGSDKLNCQPEIRMKQVAEGSLFHRVRIGLFRIRVSATWVGRVSSHKNTATSRVKR